MPFCSRRPHLNLDAIIAAEGRIRTWTPLLRPKAALESGRHLLLLFFLEILKNNKRIRNKFKRGGGE